jgi:hypothetical protein
MKVNLHKAIAVWLLLVVPCNALAASSNANKYAGLNGVYSGTVTLDSEFGCNPVSASTLNIKHKVTVKKNGAVTVLDKDATGKTVLTLGGFITTGTRNKFSAVNASQDATCSYSTYVQYTAGKKKADVQIDQITSCETLDYTCSATYKGTLKHKASGK